MKRVLWMMTFAGAIALSRSDVRAQDTSAAALIAERQDMEERYKHLSSAVEALQASDTALQKQIAALAAEVRELRQVAGKPPAAMATQDDIKRLAEKIVEVDKAREANNKLVLEKISELGKLMAKPAPPPRTPAADPAPPARPERGYEYEVKQGDTLMKIIEAYRKELGIKVTQKQVQDANPSLNPNKMQVGQKIFIPDVKP